MPKLRLLILFSVFLLTILNSLHTFKYFGARVATSPDEKQALFFSELLAHKGTLRYYNPLNNEFPEQIFSSRQFVQIAEYSAPSAFLGYVVYLALLRGIDESLLYVSGILLALICLLYTYKIAQYFSNNSVAITAITILSVFPPFIFWMLSYFNNLAELTFLVIAIYYLFKLTDTNQLRYYLLVTTFFTLVIWVRYTNLLLLPFLFVFHLVLHKHKINLKYFLYSIVLFSLLIFPLFYSNKVLFGSPFLIGQNSPNQMVYPVALVDAPKELIRFVPFRSFGILFKNAKVYLFDFIPLIIIICVFGLMNFFIRRDKRIYSLLVTILLWVLYYLGGLYFGYNDTPVLSSSYTRYLLIAYTILIILFSIGINSIRNKYIHVLIIAAVLFTSLDQVYNTRYGIRALDGQIESAHAWLTRVDKQLPKNAIVFVKGADKTIFPTRQTALYLMLSKDEKYPGEGKERTINLMSLILDKGYPVYLLKEDNFYTGEPVENYLKMLEKHNLKVTEFKSDIQMYEIGKI